MRVLCRRTTPDDFGRNRWADISIPVLRVEDDGKRHALKCGSAISIHVLRVEDDGQENAFTAELHKFQSTSSVWRTTPARQLACLKDGISIHVLRVEDDARQNRKVSRRHYFNPRPPCGGRPAVVHQRLILIDISIHVLRVEDDLHLYKFFAKASKFQSTSSVWRTTSSSLHLLYGCKEFQSTSSVWRTTRWKAIF